MLAQHLSLLLAIQSLKALILINFKYQLFPKCDGTKQSLILLVKVEIIAFTSTGT